MKVPRRHFIVKHNIEALEALPHCIWNSSYPESQVPHGYRKVRKGDRWIAFAYTAVKADKPRDEKLSLITGIYECVSTAKFLKIPPRAEEDAGHKGRAWFIKGEPIRPYMKDPLTVPSINTMLRRTSFGRTTLVPISKVEFERIREHVQKHRFDPSSIPLLHREPRCEQEVLAMIAYAHKKLGIERIERARTRFPDTLVKLQGKRGLVHLELELYAKSFLNHNHHHLVSRNGTFLDPKDKKVARWPVGVLCWIDDDKCSEKTKKRTRVRDYVSRVFELQGIVRDGTRIKW